MPCHAKHIQSTSTSWLTGLHLCKPGNSHLIAWIALIYILFYHALPCLIWNHWPKGDASDAILRRSQSSCNSSLVDRWCSNLGLTLITSKVINFNGLILSQNLEYVLSISINFYHPMTAMTKARVPMFPEQYGGIWWHMVAVRSSFLSLPAIQSLWSVAPGGCRWLLSKGWWCGLSLSCSQTSNYLLVLNVGNVGMIHNNYW